jgi:hypothetical protein
VSNFIRVGEGSLRPRRNEGRWSEEQPGWTCSALYGYLESWKWPAIVDFQTQPVIPTDQLALLKEMASKQATFQDYINTPYGQEIDRKLKLNPGKSTVWQMNVFISKKLQGPPDCMRMCACFGQMHLEEWSWFKAFVALPIARFCARILTWMDV